jgi:hypothetical protein
MSMINGKRKKAGDNRGRRERNCEERPETVMKQ